MILRHTDGSVSADDQGVHEVAGKRRSKTAVLSARKPSERFMRSPVRAKPKASMSERRRLDDLTSRLDAEPENPANDVTTRFPNYRPGHVRPPG
jgi:hypothetical protein